MTKSSKADARTPFEWAVLSLAGLAIAGIVAALVVAGVQTKPPRPNLRAQVTEQGEGSGGRIYQVTVRNDGGRTAENVVVEVTVGSEKRETELIAVTRGDQEQASVVFPPTASGTARATVLSYTEPGR